MLLTVFFQVVKREGSGTESPMIGDKVTVHYTGWLLDGTKFDSSLDRRDKFSFDLGKGNILGLVLTLVLLRWSSLACVVHSHIKVTI